LHQATFNKCPVYKARRPSLRALSLKLVKYPGQYIREQEKLETGQGDLDLK